MSNKPVKLYLDYLSQPSRAVLAFCKLSGVSYEVIETRIFRLQMRTPEFRKINPMCKVPALQDPNYEFYLAQSHAIMKYLSRRYSTNELLYPTTNLQRMAKIDEYLDFHHTNTRKCASVVFNSLFAKKLGIQTKDFDIEKAKKQTSIALKAIDQHYLSKGKYIIDNELSLADLSAYFEIQFLLLVGWDFSKWINLNNWMKRMSEIKQIQQCNVAFKKLLQRIHKPSL